jgi:hypothetical protein
MDAVVALIAGLVAGTYAGLLGVGGGIVMVPALTILLAQGQQVAQGTSLLVIIATAIAGTRANARRGLLDRPLATVVGAAGTAGAAIGSLLAVHVLGPEALRRVFGVLLLLVAARMLFERGRGEASPSVGDAG